MLRPGQPVQAGRPGLTAANARSRIASTAAPLRRVWRSRWQPTSHCRTAERRKQLGRVARCLCPVTLACAREVCERGSAVDPLRRRRVHRAHRTASWASRSRSSATCWPARSSIRLVVVGGRHTHGTIRPRRTSAQGPRTFPARARNS